MSSAVIAKETFAFLTDLAANNNREWFQEHKARYTTAHTNVIAFAEALFDRMIDEDNLVAMSGKQMLYRIYRDVRFAKDKSPYKNHFSGRMKRATKLLRGGYYFALQPGGESMLAGGFFNPNPADLLLIREAIAADERPMRKLIAADSFQAYFGTLRGSAVKTAPKGFSKAHPAIDLIRHKSFILQRRFSDRDVLSKHFLDEAVRTYLAMHPFFDYMTEVLTLDEHGVVRKDL